MVAADGGPARAVEAHRDSVRAATCAGRAEARGRQVRAQASSQRQHLRQISNSTTAAADLPKAAGNMSSSSTRSAGSCRPFRGSTWWRTRRSDSRRRSQRTGYTWSGNSHDNRLTPWSNDPVRDPAGEVLFIRDDEAGISGRRRPFPRATALPYVVRHAQGESVYEHLREDIASSLVVFVPPTETVKVFRLTLRNDSSRQRRCSVTLYVDWVLGEHRSGIAPPRGHEPRRTSPARSWRAIASATTSPSAWRSSICRRTTVAR